MLPDLKIKIQENIKHNNFDEATVLYILIQSRKLMELTNKRKTLQFYCNWVSHSKIDRKSVFMEELSINLKKISTSEGSPIKMFFGFLSFKDFRSDFSSFIKENIDSEMDLEKINFKDFEDKLKSILIDIKIEINIENNLVILFFNKDNELEIKNLPNKPSSIKLNLIDL